jgi:hypothetical protein
MILGLVGRLLGAVASLLPPERAAPLRTFAAELLQLERRPRLTK